MFHRNRTYFLFHVFLKHSIRHKNKENVNYLQKINAQTFCFWKNIRRIYIAFRFSLAKRAVTILNLKMFW